MAFRLGVILLVSIACLKAAAASHARQSSDSSAASGKAWEMLLLFNDDTSVKINVTEGSLITFSGRDLNMDDINVAISRIRCIRFISSPDSVVDVVSPELTITVRRDFIEISGPLVAYAPIAIYDFGGLEADVPVSSSGTDSVEVDCRSLPPGHWILKVNDKSLKFTR